ncbi:hypothetical protein BD410DRAFT_491562 [Rickenella mellea]|uniref:Uncharacterized protein n=1 Tax=Rickenella mellea TaxID=50990 RepID=A0A4Y7PUA7_9AGAM|nr:hypothetical protein BD410DRAFT_491562 [Rickenella mellea]
MIIEQFPALTSSRCTADKYDDPRVDRRSLAHRCRTGRKRVSNCSNLLSVIALLLTKLLIIMPLKLHGAPGLVSGPTIRDRRASLSFS